MKDDIALVAAALSGDPEMFSPIVERYQDAVFAIALARLRNFTDAEDMAQEVFVEAFENLGKLIPLLTDPSWRIRSYVASVLYGQDYFEGYVKYVPLDCVVRSFLAEKNQIVKQNLIKLMRAILDAQESDESKRR
jgi:hypothetical protein